MVERNIVESASPTTDKYGNAQTEKDQDYGCVLAKLFIILKIFEYPVRGVLTLLNSVSPHVFGNGLWLGVHTEES